MTHHITNFYDLCTAVDALRAAQCEANCPVHFNIKVEREYMGDDGEQITEHVDNSDAICAIELRRGTQYAVVIS